MVMKTKYVSSQLAVLMFAHNVSGYASVFNAYSHYCAHKSLVCMLFICSANYGVSDIGNEGLNVKSTFRGFHVREKCIQTFLISTSVENFCHSFPRECIRMISQIVFKFRLFSYLEHFVCR